MAVEEAGQRALDLSKALSTGEGRPLSASDATRDSSEGVDYDQAAEEYGWRGPEVAFGLAYAFIEPGQTLLDIGIGTGLGSVLFHKAGLRIYGMDLSPEMLTACRKKAFAADLQQHDLTVEPYPYADTSVDHAICVGVLQFIPDVACVYREVSRILRDDGTFTFIVADRMPGEDAELAVGTEHTESGETRILYRLSGGEVGDLLGENGFAPLRNVMFSVPMDRERKRLLRVCGYVARRVRRV